MGAGARAAPRLRLRCYLITTAWIVGAEKLHTVYIRFNAWAAPVDKPQLDYTSLNPTQGVLNQVSIWAL